MLCGAQGARRGWYPGNVIQCAEEIKKIEFYLLFFFNLEYYCRNLEVKNIVSAAREDPQQGLSWQRRKVSCRVFFQYNPVHPRPRARDPFSVSERVLYHTTFRSANISSVIIVMQTTRTREFAKFRRPKCFMFPREYFINARTVDRLYVRG